MTYRTCRFTGEVAETRDPYLEDYDPFTKSPTPPLHPEEWHRRLMVKRDFASEIIL